MISPFFKKKKEPSFNPCSPRGVFLLSDQESEIRSRHPQLRVLDSQSLNK